MTVTTATPATPACSASFQVSGVSAVDLSRVSDPINTGVGFFDHMLDQLNSHAQVGVSVTALACNSSSNNSNSNSNNNNIDDRNRYAEPVEKQAELMVAVGAALGAEIGKLLADKLPSAASGSASLSPVDFAALWMRPWWSAL